MVKMFTEAQKKRLMDWEAHRKAEGVTSGILEDWVDFIPIRQVAVFQKAGIITDFKDYGKDHQKCIRIDVKMLMEAVKEITSPRPVGRPTLPPEEHRPNHMVRASDKEWLLIKRFKECLEVNPDEAERALRMLESRI